MCLELTLWQIWIHVLRPHPREDFFSAEQGKLLLQVELMGTLVESTEELHMRTYLGLCERTTDGHYARRKDAIHEDLAHEVLHVGCKSEGNHIVHAAHRDVRVECCTSC